MPYSYVVDMGDGSRRHLHTNRIRKFIVRTRLVGIIKEYDDEFGEVPLGPTGKYEPLCLPSQKIDTECLTHLDNVHHTELLHVLHQSPECFSDKPGLCELVTHEIKVTPEFKPKQFKAYWIPKIVKGEIDQQIDELLKQGFIKRLKSPNGKPYCLCTEKGQVSLTCGFRYVNKYAVPDGFPMQNIDEMKLKVGRSNFISVFDAKSGYWQIKVHEEDQWFTAFSTHDSLYEWTRVPFRKKNCRATSVTATQMILKPIKSIAESYVDDMAVHFGDWHTHWRDIKRY